MSYEREAPGASYKEVTPKGTPELSRKQLHSVHSMQELIKDFNAGKACTDLHEAILLYQVSSDSKYLAMIQHLLDDGHSPFTTMKDEHSAIELVAKFGSIKIFDIIEEASPLTDDQKFDLMLIAARNITQHDGDVKYFMSYIVYDTSFPINYIHSEKQCTLIQSVAEENIFSAMSELLILGADPLLQGVDMLPKNALEAAAYAGASESYDELWAHVEVAHLYSSDKEKFELMLQASHSLPNEGSKQIIQKIIESGFNFDYQNDDGETLAMVAALRNQNHLLEYLMDYGLIKDSYIDLATQAASNGGLESFTIIKRISCEFNNFQTNPDMQYKILKSAVLNMNDDNMAKCKEFISTVITSTGYDIGYQTELHASLLCDAAESNHLSTGYLLELGADPSLRYDRLNAAQIAAKNGNLESFAEICTKNVELAYFSNEAFPYNPLATAVLYFDEHPIEIGKFIQHLLSSKVYEVDSKICNGRTALIVAILEDKLEAAKILVAEGADVNIVINDQPPFALACEYQRLEIATYILQLPQFVADEYIVHDAVKSQNLELLQAICAKYPQFINIVDERGHTPLDMLSAFCAETGDMIVFQPLIEELISHKAEALLMCEIDAVEGGVEPRDLDIPIIVAGSIYEEITR